VPLRFNLRHLEHQNLTLEGELAVAELDLDGMDELIRVNRPVWHRLEVERHEQGVLVHGSLKFSLLCECARCLKAFEQRLEFPDWTCHLPLEGEDKVLIANDCVDLTPYIREDILLAFPQHPLCESECRGLPAVPAGANQSSGASQTKTQVSAWAELNKLKL
jgi:uncharacterized protein